MILLSIGPLNDNTDDNSHDSVHDNDNDPPSFIKNITARRKAKHKQILQDANRNNDKNSKGNTTSINTIY